LESGNRLRASEPGKPARFGGDNRDISSTVPGVNVQVAVEITNVQKFFDEIRGDIAFFF
jgi:hypothetical protein